MSNLKHLEDVMQVAPLKLVIHDSIADLGRQVNEYLVETRKKVNQGNLSSPAFQGYQCDDYIADCECPRFGSGEGKCIFHESIRGKDLYILADVVNHSLTYPINGFVNHMSPDDIYQDIKRIIAASAGKAHRITVVMPFLYESRQHKRYGRESLDCAYAIEELSEMGVTNIVTFDAHDPRVQNSAPLCGFDNFQPPYQFIRTLLHYEKDLVIDKDNLENAKPIKMRTPCPTVRSQAVLWITMRSGASHPPWPKVIRQTARFTPRTMAISNIPTVMPANSLARDTGFLPFLVLRIIASVLCETSSLKTPARLKAMSRNTNQIYT